MNKIISGLIVLIVLILAIAVIMEYSGKPAQTTTTSLTTNTTTTTTTTATNSSSGTLALLLTDPPILPVGAENLTLSYKGIILHSSGQNYSVNESGSINLLSLVNLTQTLAVLKIPANTVFDSVTFDNASATIKINNISYTVMIPSGSFTARIKNNNTLSSNSAVLIDMSPSIVQIYNNSNSTFILHPEAIATIVSQNNVSAKVFTPHSVNPLNLNETKILKDLKSSIKLGNITLSDFNNTLSLSVSVINNGTSNVTIKHIMVIGFMSGSTNGSANGIGMGIESQIPIMPIGKTNNSSIQNITNIIANVTSANKSTMHPIFVRENGSGHEQIGINNSEAGIGIGEIESGRFDLGFNSSAINETVMKDMRGNISNPEVERVIREADRFDHNFHDMLNFIVESNGTLSLPFDAQEDEGPNGFNITSGGSEVFKFNGKVSLGDGRINVNLIPNQTYRIVVIGEDHAFAYTSVVYKG